MKNFKSYTDQQIVDAIRSGDNSGYLAIYHSRTDSLKNYIKNNGGSADDAEEIEQKTIVILYEKIITNTFSLEQNTKLSTFLFSIGKNLWYKQKGSKHKHFLSVDEGLLTHESLDVDDLRFKAIDEEENLLIQAIGLLGDRCQKILKAKYYQKITDRELSVEMGDMEEQTIRKKRYKCMSQLKNHFTKLTNRL